MRVLQLHNHHGSKGGAMEVLAAEADLLATGGHEVEQFTLPAAEELGLSPVRGGVKAVWNVDVSRRVTQHIRGFRPDVVHVHTPFPLMSPVVFRAAAKMRVPAVTTVHSFRYSCIAATCSRDGAICEDCVGKRLKLPGVRHRCYHDSVGASAALTASLVLHRHIGTFHRGVARFITLTGFASRLLVRDGIPESKVVVKPNFVADPGERSTERTGEPYLAFVGRLIDVKGVRTLLDAWARTPHGMRLRIAGDGPLRPLVEERARADSRIDYVGWLDEQDVMSLMAGAECVVVPSEWYEAGLPLVALRSLAVGTPVLVSDLENISAEVLADGAGVSFGVGDSASLAKRLTEVVTDIGVLRERRTDARAAYVRRYAPKGNLRRLEQIYAEVRNTAAG